MATKPVIIHVEVRDGKVYIGSKVYATPEKLKRDTKNNTFITDNLFDKSINRSSKKKGK
jgi:hypothetical protein